MRSRTRLLTFTTIGFVASSVVAVTPAGAVGSGPSTDSHAALSGDRVVTFTSATRDYPLAEATPGEPGAGSVRVHPAPRPGDTSEQWRLTPIDDGFVLVNNVRDGACLMSSAYVTLQMCNSGAKDDSYYRFKLTTAADGTVLLQSEFNLSQAKEVAAPDKEISQSVGVAYPTGDPDSVANRWCVHDVS